MEDELLNRIRKDLEKSGLSSELEACSIFEENGWRVTSGGSYFDKDEQKSREIDIVAYKANSITSKGNEDEYLAFNDFNILAEVKKSEKPWVVFKKNDKYKRVLDWMEITDMNFLNSQGYYLSLFLEKESNFFEKEEHISGIHEAFKNPNDHSRWYSACMSALKASLDKYESQINELGEEFRKSHTMIDIYYPLIILNGKLVSATLNKNNGIDLEYVNNVVMNFEYGTKYYEHSPYKVRIVTLEGLDLFLKRIHNQQIDINKAIIHLENFNKNNLEMYDNEYVELN